MRHQRLKGENTEFCIVNIHTFIWLSRTYSSLPLMQVARYNLKATTLGGLISHYMVFTFAWFRLMDHTLTLWYDSPF